MGTPIASFVAELQRRADLLDHAGERDEITYAPRRPTPKEGGRFWTRQDGNRFWFDAVLHEMGDVHPAMFEKRMATRTIRVVSRLKRRPIEATMALAMQEAERRGIYAVVAPLIVRAAEAYHGLLEMHAGYPVDWREVQAEFADAIAEIQAYLPPEAEAAVEVAAATAAVENRFKAPPCPKCSGKAKVSSKQGRTRYMKCVDDNCGHAWKVTLQQTAVT